MLVNGFEVLWKGLLRVLVERYPFFAGASKGRGPFALIDTHCSHTISIRDYRIETPCTYTVLQLYIVRSDIRVQTRR